MKKSSKTVAVLIGIAVVISGFLTVLDYACFDRSFYPKEYAKYNNAEIIGISDEELMKATNVLLDYIVDKREDMVVIAKINGAEREVFNEKETAHMVDVKTLYLNAMAVRNGCVVIAAVLSLYLLIKHKKEAMQLLASGYIKACGIFLAVIGGIGFFAYVDFSRFWTLFHEIFFSNDLWLLNPKTDIMIQMVPEGFFYDLVFRIAILFVVAAAILFVLSTAVLRKKVQE